MLILPKLTCYTQIPTDSNKQIAKSIRLAIFIYDKTHEETKSRISHNALRGTSILEIKPKKAEGAGKGHKETGQLRHNHLT